ncbi:hypothetical protein LBMAG27_15180 [Bacteroidota bacterium]|nr:hypothetical protein LBMAG27_15180 [Bacteroidota bacterium]
MIDTLILFVFRPYDPIKILGLSVQGILPSLQNEIAAKAGEWAQQNISTDKMESFLLSEESLKEMHVYMEEKADDFIRNKLTERISLLKMFITEGIINQAKEVLVEQLDKMIPELIQGIIPKVSEKINIKSTVENRIKNYPLQHLEMEMKARAQKKLFSLKLLFAVLGFLLGFVEISLVIF